MNNLKLSLLSKGVVRLFLLVLVGCNAQNDTQKQIEKYQTHQTINAMDAHGFSIRYKVQYEIIGETKISATDIDEIKLKTQWVVTDFIDQQLLIEDCLLKKDSVEAMITKEVISKNKTDFSRIDSFSIEETAVPEKILEVILERYPQLKGKNIVPQK